MKLLRGAVALGLALGVLFTSCKPDPKTLNGTALYVNNLFDNSYKIRQLRFIGQNSSGNEVFQRADRPAVAGGDDLPSPQTVRILLNDNLAGTHVVLTVYALDAEGEVAEDGTATVKVVLGVETDVTVNMKPFELPDAGSGPDAGFVDAGSFDASLPDGGVATCGCTTTCCVPGINPPDGGSCASFGSSVFAFDGGLLPPLQFTLQFCGTPKSLCVPGDRCDVSRASTCMPTDAGPTCSCGSLGAQCSQGERCADVKGTMTCVCDQFSDCSGCCNRNASGSQCRASPTAFACGAAGLTCEACAVGALGCNQPGAGTGVCNNSISCAGCTSTTGCCSGTKCASAIWPTCRALALQSNTGAVCQACDVARTDRCSSNGQCACGDKAPCGSGQYCHPPDGGGGGGRCVPL